MPSAHPSAPLAWLPGDWERALCVVAHPDDLEYGAAGAVARWTAEGRTVTYLLATRGEAGIDAMPPHEAGPRREAEERTGAAEVGVDVVEFLGLTDGIVEYGLPLRREIARVVRRRRPELLVGLNFRLSFGGPSFNMADHRAVGEALLDAARDAGNRWIFPELVDGGFDPWNRVRLVAFAGSPEPTHAVDITGHLDRSVASLRAHRAYLDGLGDESFDPDAFLRAMAQTVGERQGVEHAVAFEVFEL